MLSRPLEYGTNVGLKPRNRRLLIRVAIAIAGVLVLLGLVVLPVSSVVTRIDTVTGSTCETTEWPLGFTTGPRVRTSAVEVRLRRSGIAWTPTWDHFGTRYRDPYGMTIGYGCSLSPPIGYLGPEFNAFVATTATDDELRALVLTLQTGTRAQQEASVRTIGNDAIDRHFEQP